jgi:exodeoxyribonuclease-1
MPAISYLFYDLETTGREPACDRIIQCAIQRTDEAFQPIGDALDILVRLDEDVIPHPGALLVNGKSLDDIQQHGISERQLASIVHEEFTRPGTIILGFNNIAFDDEFIRYLLWRNFYDPYSWSFDRGCSRWDMLPVTQFIRALRHEGIEWPLSADGTPSNRLEHLTQANNLTHTQAHDGLSDVTATINLARLLHERQPRVFDFLRANRGKEQAKAIVAPQAPKPFVLTFRGFDHQYYKTSVAIALDAPDHMGRIFAYDLRYDPTPWAALAPGELATIRRYTKKERENKGLTTYPFFYLALNKCAPMAPLETLNKGTAWQRIGLTSEIVASHLEALYQSRDFVDTAREVESARVFESSVRPAEEALYDKFLDNTDKHTCAQLAESSPQRLATWNPVFHDERLDQLLLHYKARHFPDMLVSEERDYWRTYCAQKWEARTDDFMRELAETSAQATPEQQGLFETLADWFQKQRAIHIPDAL